MESRANRLKKNDKRKIVTLFKHGLSNQEIAEKLGFKLPQVSGQTRKLKKDTNVMVAREEALAGKRDVLNKVKAQEKKKSRALLFYKRGTTYQDIAKKMGVSIATIIKWLEPFKDVPEIKELRTQARKAKPNPSSRKKPGRKKSSKPPIGTDEVRKIILANPGIKMTDVATKLGKPYSYVTYRRKYIKVPKVVVKKASSVRSPRKESIPTHLREFIALIPPGYVISSKAEADISMEIHLRRK